MAESYSSTQKLLDWYYRHKRNLEFRDSGDPYKIWVSEIMLQQTRVDQMLPYYRRFIEAFPTVKDLASADQQEVLRLWEGLGYYSRALNLHEAARQVVNNHNGKLPETRDELQNLKGIGPYTSAAIASIAYNQPYPVVDGNVERVISRYFGFRDDIRKQKTKKQIESAVYDLIPKENPGDFNQAVMELGATICLPKNPQCRVCPLSDDCVAGNLANTDKIPYKSPAKSRPHHEIGIGIIRDDQQQVLIAKRPENAMLGGLWEFPGGKRKDGEELESTVIRELKEELGVTVSVDQPFMKLKHAYSHFTVHLHAYLCRIKNGIPEPNSSTEIRWVTTGELSDYPFPKANRKLTEALQNKLML